MANIFIFHGTGGYPEENWFPWLKEKLEVLGHKVVVPQFPTPDNQTPESWFEAFRKYEESLDENTIIIGHSLGGAFLLHLLEKVDVQIKAAYFVAAPVGILPLKNYETDKPFIDQPFDWDKIKANSKEFYVYHSDNDPFVSLENGQELAKKLDTELTFVPNAGHFNASAGYKSFDILLKQIIISANPK